MDARSKLEALYDIQSQITVTGEEKDESDKHL